MMNLKLIRQLTTPSLAEAGLLFGLILLLWASQTKKQPDSWNDASRLAAVQALVEQQVWHIDQTRLGEETGDKIFFEGHFYSSKPPLLAALTALPYRLLHQRFGATLKPEACTAGEVCAYYWLSLLMVGLPSALMIALFYHQARQSFDAFRPALLLTGLFVFGSMIWPFSLVYNNHIPTAASLFISFLLLPGTSPLERPRRGKGERGRSAPAKISLRLFCSGLLAGLAVSFELTAIFLAVALALLALIYYRRAAFWFALGGVLPLLATIWLNDQMIGHLLPPYFLREGYNYPGGPFQPTVGGTTSPHNILSYTFRSLVGDRGLLLYSPLLFWTIAGLINIARRRQHPRRLEGAVFALAMLAQATFIYTRTNNFGGKAYGGRYFIILLPFLFYFLIFSLPTSLTGSSTFHSFRRLKRPRRGKIALAAFALAALLSVTSAYQGSRAPWQTIQPLLFLQTRPYTPPVTVCSNLQVRPLAGKACLDTMLYPCGLASFGLVRRQFERPPMQHTLLANFADQVMLLGYDLPARRLKRGEDLPLTIYWQSLAEMNEDYIQFNHLLDSQLVKQVDQERLPVKPYTTSCWKTGEVIVDHYTLAINDTTPAGVYQLLLGLYPARLGYTAPLHLVQEGKPTDWNVPGGGTTSVTIGPLKVAGPPPGAVVSEARPAHPLDITLGGVISLRGYDLVPGDEELLVRLYWESLGPTETDYTVFVHLRNQTPFGDVPAGELMAQLDRPPLAGAYPTSLWAPGEIIRDEIILPLPADLPAAKYTILVGLYDFASGARLPVAAKSSQRRTSSKGVSSTDDSIELAVVEIGTSPRSTPRRGVKGVNDHSLQD